MMSREGRELFLLFCFFLDPKDQGNPVVWGWGLGRTPGSLSPSFLPLPPPGRRLWWRIQSGLGGWALGTAASKLAEVMALAATRADGPACPRQ